MSLGWNSIGHFFASAFHDIIVGAKAVEKAGVVVAQNAPLVEALTSLVPVYGGPAASLERVAFGVFGQVAGAAVSVDNAAAANGINVQLDAEMVADIRALIAQFPDIVAQAKAAFPRKGGRMIGLLISLLILVLIFAVIWWILKMIPVPAPFAWIVQVIFAIIFLIALVSLLTGGWGFPLHGAWR